MGQRTVGGFDAFYRNLARDTLRGPFEPVHRNSSKKHLTDDEIRQLAIDIMEERVLTSMDLFLQANGDSSFYLFLLKEYFSDESLAHCLPQIVDYISTGGHYSHVMWYAYLKDKIEDGKSFTKSYFICGDDYFRLKRHLKEQAFTTGALQ